MKNAIFSIIFVIGVIAGAILLLGLFSAYVYIFGEEGGDPGAILRFLKEPIYLIITIILTALAVIIGYFKKIFV